MMVINEIFSIKNLLINKKQSKKINSLYKKNNSSKIFVFINKNNMIDFV